MIRKQHLPEKGFSPWIYRPCEVNLADHVG